MPNSKNVVLTGAITGKMDLKRFYMGGVTLQDKCPKCGVLHEDVDPMINYPVMNQPFQMHMYCDECEHEWSVTVQLTVSLALVEEA